jgi:hypothetical protein
MGFAKCSTDPTNCEAHRDIRRFLEVIKPAVNERYNPLEVSAFIWRIQLRSFSSVIAFIPATVGASISIVLALSMGGTTALAEILPGATCPPDYNCFSIEPRDGACRHPTIILDAKVKGYRYEDSPFSETYENVCIAQTNTLAVRRGLELRLKIGNGTSKAYKNNFDAAGCERHQGSCKTYFLYDYFPEHGLFLINVGYNEDREWLLVSRANGKEQKIIAPPGYSPGKKWLAAVYATDGGDDENNGIDVFPADLSPAEPGFHYRPTEYEQWELVGWDGDDRLLLNVTWRVGNDPDLVKWSAEAIRVNGKWQLNRLAPVPRP